MSGCCAPANRNLGKLSGCEHRDLTTGGRTSDCCGVGDGCQEVANGVCPSCQLRAKPVATITVKNLVIDHTRVRPEQSFSFCRTPGCAVVYFSDAATFRKPDLKVRVGLKEHEEPIPLCYCFGYNREDIRRDFEQHGASDIPSRIKAEVQGGFCACEVKNPSGSCCLGDINRAVKETQEAIGAIPVDQGPAD